MAFRRSSVRSRSAPPTHDFFAETAADRPPFLFQPVTGKPSRSAAAARRWSRHTNASVEGRPSAAESPAASCSASAARRSWVRRKRSACSRSTSDGCTSCHVAAKRSSRLRAAAAERGRSMLSRSRRAIADSHSTRVPHQARMPASARYRARMRLDARWRTISGTSAELSQNLSDRSCVPREWPQQYRLPLQGREGGRAQSLRVGPGVHDG
jgi:hypothetical protein